MCYNSISDWKSQARADFIGRVNEKSLYKQQNLKHTLNKINT